MKMNVRVVVFKEENEWICAGANYDAIGHGSTIKEAKESFDISFYGKIASNIRSGRDPMFGFKHADNDIWLKYQAADFYIHPVNDDNSCICYPDATVDEINKIENFCKNFNFKVKLGV